MTSICKIFFVQNDMTLSSGAVQTGGNITSTGTITGNTLSIADGLNLGTITQVSTELTLSSTGNRVALADANNLIFKNDSSMQRTAYTGRHKIDPADIHSFIQNRIIIKQTFSVQNPNLTLVGVGGGNILFYNLGTLRKGQVIRGAFFWHDSVTTCHVGLYTQSNPTLVASTATNASTVSGMNYIDFSSQYTIPTTQVYFIAARHGAGQGLSLNPFGNFNYGFSASTGALTANTQYTSSTYASLPATLAGVGMTTSTYNVLYGIYG